MLIIPELFSILFATDYFQNYSGIIDGSLHAMLHHFHHVLIQVTNYEIYINLHVFKAIAASCVNIIVKKRLNKYNYISTLQYLVPVTLCSTML